jgi:Alpha-kinase family
MPGPGGSHRTDETEQVLLLETPTPTPTHTHTQSGSVSDPTRHFSKAERAMVHAFNSSTTKWSKSLKTIRLCKTPFGQGALRLAYHAKVQGSDGTFVCKFAKDPSTPLSLYFSDVEAQGYAQSWALKFNECDPPKKVSFVSCYVMELVDRPGRPVCGCERMIPGKFEKHNNNVGAVNQDIVMSQSRAIPSAAASSSSSSAAASSEAAAVLAAASVDQQIAQAFSHFTYERSKGHILVCDIQGVGGQYTDPQIHTLDISKFGSGNLGYTGIRAFLLRHQCNAACRRIGLSPIDPKQLQNDPTPSVLTAPSSTAAAAAAAAASSSAAAATSAILNNGMVRSRSRPRGMNGLTLKPTSQSLVISGDEKKCPALSSSPHSASSCGSPNPSLRRPASGKTMTAAQVLAQATPTVGWKTHHSRTRPSDPNSNVPGSRRTGSPTSSRSTSTVTAAAAAVVSAHCPATRLKSGWSSNANSSSRTSHRTIPVSAAAPGPVALSMASNSTYERSTHAHSSTTPGPAAATSNSAHTTTFTASPFDGIPAVSGTVVSGGGGAAASGNGRTSLDDMDENLMQLILAGADE